MVARSLTAAGAFLGGSLVAASALADPGTVTATANMRTGPGTDYTVITAIPEGAQIEVLDCGGWCRVAYAGRTGYVSGRYVATGYARAEPPRVYYRPAPRVYYGYSDPWWYDGDYYFHRPYYPYRRWHHGYPYSHGGIGFSFSFGD